MILSNFNNKLKVFLLKILMKDNDKNNIKISFLSSIIGFYIVHAGFFIWRFANEDYRHYVKDFINGFYINGSRPELGRIFGGFLEYMNPWTVGFFCAILLSFTSVLVSFPSLACTYGYLTMAEIVSISIFCSIAAVYVTQKYDFGFLVGAILLMISIGEYQAYVAVAASLSFVSVIVEVLNDKCLYKKHILMFSKYLIMGILGVILYLIAVKIYLSFTGYTLSDYKGISSLGSYSFKMLPDYIKNSYVKFLDFFHGRKLFYVSEFINFIYIIIAVLSIILIKTYLSKNYKMLVILLIAILLFPISVNLIEIIAPESGIDTISCYSFVITGIFILALLNLNNEKNIYIKSLISLCLCFVILNNYLTCSRYYLQLDTVYERTSFFENRL